MAFQTIQKFGKCPGFADAQTLWRKRRRLSYIQRQVRRGSVFNYGISLEECRGRVNERLPDGLSFGSYRRYLPPHARQYHYRRKKVM
jgi:hypothetical protein